MPRIKKKYYEKFYQELREDSERLHDKTHKPLTK